MLCAKNISKTIGDRSILANVSLSVERGEIVCVIGPSGAGKTSLLRVLSLLDQPDTGSIEIDTHRYDFPILPNTDLPLPYPKLTVVFQQLFIWPHLTIRQNMLLPLRQQIDEPHMNRIIQLFRMHDFLDRYPNEVSIGQRQRAAIARALLLRPSYLLLDEITSALDVEQAHLIVSHLNEIARGGVAVILVTHALHLVRSLANTVIFLDAGTITEHGTPAILANPHSKRLREFVMAAGEPMKA